MVSVNFGSILTACLLMLQAVQSLAALDQPRVTAGPRGPHARDPCVIWTRIVEFLVYKHIEFAPDSAFYAYVIEN